MLSSIPRWTRKTARAALSFFLSPPPTPPLRFEGGLLVASPEAPYAVFYAPTREVAPRPGPPQQVILHHTACKASERPRADMETLLRRAGYTAEQAAGLLSQVGDGPIPSALALALQAAGDWDRPKESRRVASWDFGVGDGPRAYLGGKVPLVQCNLRLRRLHTWHARRWSPASIGIEVEYYGYLEGAPGAYLFDADGPGVAPPKDVTDRLPGGVQTVQSRTCERLHPLTRQALYDLARAVVAEFDLSPAQVVGHRDVDPTRKVDPHPAYTVEEVREILGR